MADTLAVVAETLLECVSEALSNDLRPVCKVYQTHGTPVIFQCCECEDEETEGANGEISIHFRRLFDADPSTLDEVRRIRPCHGGVTAAQFRLVLARCRPIINEKGEIPPPEELTEHTLDQLRDIELLWQSLACCSGLTLRIDDVSADLSDPGTCSVIYADVTVQVGVPALPEPPVPVPDFRTAALGDALVVTDADTVFNLDQDGNFLTQAGETNLHIFVQLPLEDAVAYAASPGFDGTTPTYLVLAELYEITANDESDFSLAIAPIGGLVPAYPQPGVTTVWDQDAADAYVTIMANLGITVEKITTPGVLFATSKAPVAITDV